MEDAFKQIYQTNWWRHGSGGGSLPLTTAQYRRLVEEFVRTYSVRSVLDIGCGDWQFSHLIDWGGAYYTGVDVVPEVIKQNQGLYGHEGVTFLCGDVFTMTLPTADLVLIKDVFQHWRNEKVLQFLPRLTSYRSVLITNTTMSYRGPAKPHFDIEEEGQFRPLDLRLPPFDMPCEELGTYDARQHSNEVPDTKTVLLWTP